MATIVLNFESECFTCQSDALSRRAFLVQNGVNPSELCETESIRNGAILLSSAVCSVGSEFHEFRKCKI